MRTPHALPFRYLVAPLVAALLGTVSNAPVFGADRLNVYYGLTHGHSSEEHDDNKQVVPYERAFDVARSSSDLDFFSLSSHAHWISDGTFQRQRAVSAGYSTRTLVTYYGTEWGKITNTGHIGIYGGESLCDVTAESRPGATRDVARLVEWFEQHPGTFGHLNHPNTHDFGGFYNPVLDDFIHGVEIVNGPAFNGRIDQLIEPVWHKSGALEMLQQGWHVGLIANQDNHRPTFGMVTACRTGIWATHKTLDDLLDAYRSRRLFATTDHNAQIELWASVRGKGPRTFMGQRLFGVDEVAFEVKSSDADGETPTSIELYHGVIGGTSLPSAIANGSGSILSHTMKADESEQFVLARLLQADGDEVWSSPLWFTQASESRTRMDTYVRLAQTVDVLSRHAEHVGASSSIAEGIGLTLSALTGVLEQYRTRTGDFLVEQASTDAAGLTADLERQLAKTTSPRDQKSLGALLAGIRTALTDAGVTVPPMPDPIDPPPMNPRNHERAHEDHHAAVAYHDQLAAGGDAGKTHLSLVKVYTNLEALDDAITHAMAAVQALSGDAGLGALDTLARAYDRKGDKVPTSQRMPWYEKSVATWEQMAAAATDSSRRLEARMFIAKQYEAMVAPSKDPTYYDKAMTIYEEVAGSDQPDLVREALEDQTALYQKSRFSGHDPAKAIEVLRGLLESASDNRQIRSLHQNLSRALSRFASRTPDPQATLEEALDHLNTAFSMNDRVLDTALMELGDLLAKMGRTEEALANYQRVVDEYYETKRGLEESMIKIGECLEKLGRIDEAIAAYRKLIDGFPNLPEVYEDADGNEVGPEQGELAMRVRDLSEGRASRRGRGARRPPDHDEQEH